MAIRLCAHCPVFHSVCCYTSGFRFAPLESLCLRYYYELVNAPSAAISIGHFVLDRDFKAFVCFRFDGSGISKVNEKRQAKREAQTKARCMQSFEDMKRSGIFIAFFYSRIKPKKNSFDQDFWIGCINCSLINSCFKRYFLKKMSLRLLDNKLCLTCIAFKDTENVLRRRWSTTWQVALLARIIPMKDKIPWRFRTCRRLL